MTKFVKKDEINSEWFEIDATGAVVGRLATVVSKIIRGKNKTTFTPHMDHGDFVVIKNVEQIRFTGNKFQNKKYLRLDMIFAIFRVPTEAPDTLIPSFCTEFLRGPYGTGPGPPKPPKSAEKQKNLLN